MPEWDTEYHSQVYISINIGPTDLILEESGPTVGGMGCLLEDRYLGEIGQPFNIKGIQSIRYYNQYSIFNIMSMMVT